MAKKHLKKHGKIERFSNFNQKTHIPTPDFGNDIHVCLLFYQS